MCNEIFFSIPGGELFDRVIEDEFILTEKACICFMRQVLEGVSFMHSKSILHLDLKVSSNHTYSGFQLELFAHLMKQNGCSLT